MSDVRGPSPVDEAAGIATTHGSTTAEAEVFCFGDSWDQVSAQYALGLNRASGTGSTGEGLLGFTFQGDGAMNDVQLFDSTTGVLRQDSSCEPARLGNYEVIPSASDASGENNSSSGSSTKFEPDLGMSERGKNLEMLLSLASDLHSKLEALVQRPLQQGEDPETLDGYHIGSVLHLSQAFANIAIACRRSRYSGSSSDPGSAMSELVSSDCAATTSESGPCNDPSMGLILLSCYITLTQVCTTVLGHFQAHLRSRPGTRNGAPPTSTTLGPQGCLGELLGTDAPHSRIHMAVCMLLQSLGQVEEALGLPLQIHVAGGGFQPWEGSTTERTAVPAALAKQDICAALGRWGALSSVASIQESFNVLEQTVADIKELLRERMGL
ncbi:uncharacterized protein E0L32_012148 [Thyridium curvatum]|uniref:Uncharacterized protein n=1 Tax=Thyridium curvatum TaxID=1093900 RepID=A0A507B368_9PEZI|nr:uncharacterized protein E0L32_012148 [Thyridium curvatum]TPX17555.1 hypothetical protein E0L32_012148 [Thyridium curvatum]